jgi:ANTAR domain-containing protein
VTATGFGSGTSSAREVIEALEQEVAQLRTALESRVVIEQAKGVLAERYRLSVDDAFLLLRTSARGARARIHDVARDVVTSPETPPAVVRGLARTSRIRAAALRERGEATVERAHALQDRQREQLDRVSRWTQKAAARVHAESRSDAVALASLLAGYRWYLIVPTRSIGRSWSSSPAMQMQVSCRRSCATGSASG